MQSFILVELAVEGMLTSLPTKIDHTHFNVLLYTVDLPYSKMPINVIANFKFFSNFIVHHCSVYVDLSHSKMHVDMESKRNNNILFSF